MQPMTATSENMCTMANPWPGHNRSLLDLPDPVLDIITTALREPDKRMFMAACRKAFNMAMLTAEMTLKVDKSAKFAGIKKVLNTFPEQLHVVISSSRRPGNINAVSNMPVSAMATFMGLVPNSYLTQVAATCHWDCITKITIQGTALRCLVPQLIALACPQLTQLKILRPTGSEHVDSSEFIFNTDPEEALPLTPCISLKQLHVEDGYSVPVDLPAEHHSPAELRHNLPSIDTLTFRRMEFPNADLIEAYAAQLTRLELQETYVKLPAIKQSIRPCSNLQHLCVPALVLPDNTANLRTLDLQFCATDKDFKRVLQVTSLTKLGLFNLYNIRKDWSHHACPWKELHLSHMIHFFALALLNLSSLSKLSVGPDVIIQLLDPSNPNSLAAVQRAADNLAHVGQLVVNENITKPIWFGQSGSLTWDIPESGSGHEEKAAELIRITAQRIGPCRVCNCEDLLHRPLVLKAVFDWGKTFIESVTLGTYTNVQQQPHVWQALQQLSMLNTLVFWHEEDDNGLESEEEDYAYELFKMSSNVCLASQHYVIPTRKGLRIECGFSRGEVDETAVTEGKTFLTASIQEVLPPGCKLVSVEFSSMESKTYSMYGQASGCKSEAFWVFVVELMQPNA